MAERRTSERLIVAPESLERITPSEPLRLAEAAAEEPTQPMRLSFLALLAERDPLVQARLNLRVTPVLEAERLANEERETDEMPATAKTGT
jgi:hypothetical protein